MYIIIVIYTVSQKSGPPNFLKILTEFQFSHLWNEESFVNKTHISHHT